MSGFSGAGGGSNETHVDNATVNEVPNGAISVFTIAGLTGDIVPESEHLYKNGLRQRHGASFDYVRGFSGFSMTFNATNIPLTGATIVVDYRKTP
jgi:hypothetical protein